MKKKNFIFFVLLSIVLILPNTVSAETITNNKGVVMTLEDYNKFLEVYKEEMVMNITEEKYELLQTLNFDDITRSSKYIETTYNPNLRLYTERELTKEEYDKFQPVNGNNSGIMPLLESQGSIYSTLAKEIELVIMGGTTYNYATFIADWKGIPTTRSYDVIGIRGTGIDVINGSQAGEQNYTLNGAKKTVNYSWDGTNINNFYDDGFGISMNIVNSDITSLTLFVECTFEPTIAHPSIYGSYQHAIDSVSLSSSKNYTFGPQGLGNIFVFPYAISIKYDGMAGVYVEY